MTDSDNRESAAAPARPDIDADLARLWDVVSNGGIAVVPSGLGYGIASGSLEGVKRINEAKGRGTHKRNGMFMGEVGAREVLQLENWQWDIIDCVIQDYDLPFGVVARYNADHPLMQKLHPELLALSTFNGTVGTAFNEGSPFLDGLSRLSYENLLPICGSSANLTGTGVKYRVEDIEEEVLAVADLVLDYGLCRYYKEKVATTQINFETMQLTRWGACFDLIADVLRRHFGIDLPPDPGRDENLNGHVNEFALGGAPAK